MLEWIEGEPPEVKAGMLVELDDGMRYLVGHINESGGLCGCCAVDGSCFFRDSIRRYAVAYEADHLG